MFSLSSLSSLSIVALPPSLSHVFASYLWLLCLLSGFCLWLLSFLSSFSLLGFSAWQQDSDLCLVLHIMLRSAHALSGCLYTDREGGRKEGVAINIICAVTAVKPE